MNLFILLLVIAYLLFSLFVSLGFLYIFEKRTVGTFLTLIMIMPFVIPFKFIAEILNKEIKF